MYQVWTQAEHTAFSGQQNTSADETVSSHGAPIHVHIEPHCTGICNVTKYIYSTALLSMVLEYSNINWERKHWNN